MSAVEPLRRLTTSDQVAAEVRRRIWHGELRAGDRLTQGELADSMGVSRIPVREALIALAHEGAISMAPHRGAFVEPLTRAGVADHYELFGHVDGFAIDKAVHRADAAERQELADRMRQAADIADAAGMQRLVVSVRVAIHELGGSVRLRAVSRGLVGLVPGNFFVEVSGSVEVAAHRLPEAGAAIEAGDGDTAVAAYRRMMLEHGDLVLELLDRRGLLV